MSDAPDRAWTRRVRAVASLGTALSFTAPAWIGALALFAYDLATLAPDVTAYDSPELATAAVQLGLSHPIGQPLHTLIGALFVRLLPIAPLTALGVCSATFHALTVVPVAAIAERLTPLDRRSMRGASVQATSIVALLACVPIWECATRVEVYTLSCFGVAWTFAWAARLDAPRITPKDAAILGAALGLTGSVNAYHAVLAALALAPAAVRALRDRRVPIASVGALVAAGLLALTPYAYVLAVGGRTDVLVWGAPVDGDSVRAYFGGADYARNRGTPLAAMLDHASAWLAWSVPSGVLVQLVIGAAGHALLGRDAPIGRVAASLLALATITLLCSHAVFHVDIVDYQNYLAPALAVCAAGSSALVVRAWRERPAVAVLVFSVCAAASLLPHPSIISRTRAGDHALGLAVRGALDEAPEGSFFVVGDDHWVAPLLYVQEVEGHRRDVVILAAGLSSSSWYWDHLARRHPDLAPFAVRGPGGRNGRLRRRLDASPDRAVFVEDADTAAELGLTPCDVGFLVRVAPCTVSLDTEGDTAVLARALDAIDVGSPASDGALAAIAMDRGTTLWRMRRVREAVLAFDAGVPPSMGEPAFTDEDLDALSGVGALGGTQPWREDAALGDARRLLFLEGMAFAVAGRGTASETLRARAAALGLPEASVGLPEAAQER